MAFDIFRLINPQFLRIQRADHAASATIQHMGVNHRGLNLHTGEHYRQAFGHFGRNDFAQPG